MYGLFGGCTTLFHLFVRHPLLVLALGMAGFFAHVPSASTIGDQYGTNGVLAHFENSLVQEHPELLTRLAALRKEFDRTPAELNENDLHRLLDYTDPCTGKDVQLSVEERREAAWLIFLEKHSRGQTVGNTVPYKVLSLRQ